jgi:hypothetical protein
MIYKKKLFIEKKTKYWTTQPPVAPGWEVLPQLQGRCRRSSLPAGSSCGPGAESALASRPSGALSLPYHPFCLQGLVPGAISSANRVLWFTDNGIRGSEYPGVWNPGSSVGSNLLIRDKTPQDSNICFH